MRNWLIATGLFFMLVTACENEPTKIEYKLSDEQLGHLLYDLYFSESVLMGQQGVHRDSIRTLFWLRMSEVYNLDEATLRAEIEKLKGDPEKLKLLFDRVKTEVDSLQ